MPRLESDSENSAFSIDDAARLSSVSRRTIIREIDAGRLMARKVGRRTVIRGQDFRAWIDGAPSARSEPGPGTGDAAPSAGDA